MSSNSKRNNNKPKSISKKEEYFYTKFSEVLQTFRNDKNLLQTDFFETTGLSNNSISKIERASSKINAFEYELIQCVLGFDFRNYIDDLFDQNSNSSKKAELVHLTKELSEEEADILLKIAYILFKKAKGEKNENYF